jgi:DNA-directed RNA polymerase subunit M/transcription elongation factor TFIIS
MKTINVKSATTRELVEFYNAHSGCDPIKKFSDRRNAEKRVEKLMAERQFKAPSPLVDNQHCPVCNSADLYFGKLVREQLVDEEHIVTCRSCGYTVDWRKSKNAKPVTKVGPRPAMKQSLKLDRRILHIETGTVYANACQVWKAALVTSSQGDRLSATLYGAAKRGEFPTLSVNGHTFELAVKGE